MLAMHVPNLGIHTLYRFTCIPNSPLFPSSQVSILFVCGRGVQVELLKMLRFVLCSFQCGIHTMHGE